MATNDRLTQLWAMLVESAHAQRVLTYAILEQLIGVPKQAIGCWLTAIQDYCNFHNLPPLTSLVLDESDDLSSRGLAEAEDVFGERARVYLFNWLSQNSPSPEDIQNATDKNINQMSWVGSWQSLVNIQNYARGDRTW